MAADVGHAHYGWPHEDPAPRNDPQEAPVSQIKDHGSISFGRYAVESLSWEKRSVFTVNRRQEELDKCSAHGLVTQKKAYFEEFYKRIRAAKTSQTDQKNQITLGNDVSTSFQIAEGETDVNAEHPGCGAIINCDSHVAKTVANGTNGSEYVHSDSRETIPIAHPKLQPSPTTATVFSTESSQDAKQNSVSIHAIQIENIGTKLITNYPLSRSREETDHDGKDNYHKEAVSGKNVSSSLKDELVISAERSPAFTPQGRLQKCKSVVSEHCEKKEAPQNNNNKNKQETASVSKLKKDHAPISRGTTKVEFRSKSSQGSNSVQKQVGKADNGIHSSKTTVNKPLGNDMSSSVSSSRLLTERRSNVTIPRPFSFATEKRATASSRLRDNMQKPASNSLASAAGNTRLRTKINVPVSCPSRRLAPSLHHAKDCTDLKELLIKTETITSDKEEKIEDKRCVGSKGRGVDMNGSSKTRSFDLPQPKEPYQLGRNNKLKVSDIKTKEKEALLSRSMNLSVGSKKPRSINLSLDGSKPRQEKPHWR